MAAVSAIAGIAGAGISAMGAMQQGEAAKEEAQLEAYFTAKRSQYEAKSLKIKGASERAAYFREASDIREAGDLVASSLRARAAAAGGGGAETAGIRNLYDQVYGETALRSELEQWKGRNAIRNRLAEGKLALWEGRVNSEFSLLRGENAYKGSMLEAAAAGVSGLGALGKAFG